jgi:hypothetical protein
MQKLEQRAAMDPEAMGCFVQIGVGEIQHDMLELVQAQEPIDPGAQPSRLFGKPEGAQDSKACRLQQKARPGRLGFSEALEDSDAVSGVGEKCRGRLAGDPTSDDADL